MRVRAAECERLSRATDRVGEPSVTVVDGCEKKMADGIGKSHRPFGEYFCALETLRDAPALMFIMA